MFFKSLYHSLIAFSTSILFFVSLTFILHLTIWSFLRIDLIKNLRNPVDLSLYLSLIIFYWAILLPFFSPYLSVVFSHQKFFFIKSILVKLLVYLFIFSFLNAMHHDFLIKKYFKKEENVKIHKPMEIHAENHLLIQNFKKQLQFSLLIQESAFKNKQNTILAVFIYGLYLLIVLFFSKKSRQSPQLSFEKYWVFFCDIDCFFIFNSLFLNFFH